jgi:predicted nucleotidyltransferase
MKILHATLLDEIVRRIVAALQPETIYLYGSHAYGQPHEDSDVDLLVVLREATRSGHENAVVAYRALRGLCVPAEVKVVTRNEFERRAQWLSSVERIAKEKGRILYAASAGRSTSMASESCGGGERAARWATAVYGHKMSEVAYDRC